MNARETVNEVLKQERLLLVGEGESYVVRTKVNGRPVGAVKFRKLGNSEVIESATVFYDLSDPRQVERAIEYAARLNEKRIGYDEQPAFSEIMDQAVEIAKSRGYDGSSLLNRLNDRRQGFRGKGLFVKFEGRVKSK